MLERYADVYSYRLLRPEGLYITIRYYYDNVLYTASSYYVL